MRRRTFLGASLLGMGSSALGAAGPGNAPVSAATLITRTVDRLETVSAQRRDVLVENPDGKTPEQLNATIPEIQAIEVDNGLAAGTPSAVPSNAGLRVVAWNMERGRHWRDGARLVSEHPALCDPDLVLLGEMDYGMARSHNEHTSREFALALGMNYAYGVEFLELTKGEKQERADYSGENERGYHGNAILSSRPLTNLRMLRFPGIEKWYGSYQKRLGGRMALFADVEVSGETVTLVVTHLESDFRDNEVRAAQGRMVLDELACSSPGNPAVLGGDLNARPSEAVIQGFRDGGFDVDGCRVPRTRTSQTVRDGKVVLKGFYIDYVMARWLTIVPSDTSPEVVLAAYPPGATGNMLGDHAIVTAAFALPGA